MSEHTRPFSRRAFVGGAAAFGISLCLPTLTPTPAHAVTAAENFPQLSYLSCPMLHICDQHL